jgi:putative transposase
MRRFKSFTTRLYIEGVEVKGWPPFYERLWQRGYHERIVRTDEGLARARRYIEENPQRWLLRTRSDG